MQGACQLIDQRYMSLYSWNPLVVRSFEVEESESLGDANLGRLGAHDPRPDRSLGWWSLRRKNAQLLCSSPSGCDQSAQKRPVHDLNDQGAVVRLHVRHWTVLVFESHLTRGSDLRSHHIRQNPMLKNVICVCAVNTQVQRSQRQREAYRAVRELTAR